MTFSFPNKWETQHLLVVIKFGFHLVKPSTLLLLKKSGEGLIPDGTGITQERVKKLRDRSQKAEFRIQESEFRSHNTEVRRLASAMASSRSSPSAVRCGGSIPEWIHHTTSCCNRVFFRQGKRHWPSDRYNNTPRVLCLSRQQA